MTDQHPLTDEICDTIQDSIHPCDPANMRAAADWQLEQVSEAWDQCMKEPGTDIDEIIIQVIRRFDQKLKAMRPNTTQEDN